MNSAGRLRQIKPSPGRRSFRFDAANRSDGTERMILPPTVQPVQRHLGHLPRHPQRRPIFAGSQTWRSRVRSPLSRCTEAFQRMTTSGSMRRPSMRLSHQAEANIPVQLPVVTKRGISSQR